MAGAVRPGLLRRTTAMKKLIAAAVLSVIAAGVTAGNASAFWPFCCHKGTIKVRPYNAFTPACFGTMYCDGCMPMQARFPNCDQGGCAVGQLPGSIGVPATVQAPAALGQPTTAQIMPQGQLIYPGQFAPNAGR